MCRPDDFPPYIDMLDVVDPSPAGLVAGGKPAQETTGGGTTLAQAVLDLIDAHRCEPHTVITNIEKRYGPPRIDPERLARAMHRAWHDSNVVLSEEEDMALHLAHARDIVWYYEEQE